MHRSGGRAYWKRADQEHDGQSQDVYKRQILNQVNARYVYGVTATPMRGDGLEKITYMLDVYKRQVLRIPDMNLHI